MTLPTPFLLSILISAIPPTTASPISPPHHPPTKRSPSPHNLGIGFAIALSLLLSFSLIFYLGVLRGRTNTWFCWRAPTSPLSRACSPSEKLPAIDTTTLKHQISSPIEIHSTALPELSPLSAHPPYAELSPVEAKKQPVLELAALEKALHLYEMGPTTPRRPPSVISVVSKRSVVSRSFYSSRKSSVATVRKSGVEVKTAKGGKNVYSSKEVPPRVGSWVERERGSWFCKGAMEVESEEMRVRGDGGKMGGEKGVSAGAAAGAAAAVAVATVPEGKEGVKRGTMDWSGMEWLSRVYGEGKSRRVSGMRSFYIQDGEEKGGV